MKRALCLLLLFAAWLLAGPGVSAPRVPAHAPVCAATDEAQVSAAAQHVAPPLALARVLRATLWARLPALPELRLRERGRPGVGRYGSAPDLRAALRRVQTRRRVPRLSSEEPPWS